MRPRSAARQPGFTLIEILVVIVMIGVLLGIAAPSFRTYTANQRVKSVSFDIYSSLAFARSEAIKRRQAVTVAPVSSADWATGWRVTTPDPANPSNTLTLRSQDPPEGVVISGSASVIYRQDGRMASASFGVLVKPGISDASISNRCIRVDIAGMPKSTTTTESTCT